jgi:hypothetical protein
MAKEKNDAEPKPKKKKISIKKIFKKDDDTNQVQAWIDAMVNKIKHEGMIAEAIRNIAASIDRGNVREVIEGAVALIDILLGFASIITLDPRIVAALIAARTTLKTWLATGLPSWLSEASTATPGPAPVAKVKNKRSPI